MAIKSVYIRVDWEYGNKSCTLTPKQYEMLKDALALAIEVRGDSPIPQDNPNLHTIEEGIALQKLLASNER